MTCLWWGGRSGVMMFDSDADRGQHYHRANTNMSSRLQTRYLQEVAELERTAKEITEMRKAIRLQRWGDLHTLVQNAQASPSHPRTSAEFLAIRSELNFHRLREELILALDSVWAAGEAGGALVVGRIDTRNFDGGALGEVLTRAEQEIISRAPEWVQVTTMARILVRVLAILKSGEEEAGRNYVYVAVGEDGATFSGQQPSYIQRSWTKLLLLRDQLDYQMLLRTMKHALQTGRCHGRVGCLNLTDVSSSHIKSRLSFSYQ
jgi:hypothetical protein